MGLPRWGWPPDAAALSRQEESMLGLQWSGRGGGGGGRGEGGGRVEAAVGVAVGVFKVFSQDWFCSVFVKQIFDDKVVYRVQQRFVEQNLVAPLRRSDVGLVAPFSDVLKLGKLDIISTSFSSGGHLPSCHATVYGGV